MGDREAFFNRIAARLGKPRKRMRPTFPRLLLPDRIGTVSKEALAALFLEN